MSTVSKRLPAVLTRSRSSIRKPNSLVHVAASCRADLRLRPNQNIQQINPSRCLSLWSFGSFKPSSSLSSPSTPESPAHNISASPAATPSIANESSSSTSSQASISDATATAATSSPQPQAVVEAATSTDLASSSGVDAIATTPQNITEHVGPLLSDYGLGESFYVGAFQRYFCWLHDVSGLPWWATLVLGASLFRIAMFHVQAKNAAHAARFSKVKDRITEGIREVRRLNLLGDKMEAVAVQSDIQKLMKEHDVHPLRMFKPVFFQASFGIGTFLAIKGMADAGWPAFKTGGALWFTDLTVSDPTYIALPAISAFITTAMIERGADTGIPMDAQQKWLIRGMGVIGAGFMAYWPAGASVYLATSGFCGAISMLVLKTPAIRKIYGIGKYQQPKPKASMFTGDLGFIESVKAGYGIGQAEITPKPSPGVTNPNLLVSNAPSNSKWVPNTDHAVVASDSATLPLPDRKIARGGLGNFNKNKKSRKSVKI